MTRTLRNLLVLILFVKGGSALGQDKKALLRAEDIEYLGAFRLPETDPKLPSRFPYGGGSAGFRPTGDGGKGSLFISGHVHHQLVAEVSLAEPKKERDVTKLNTCALLQPFGDVTGGLIRSLGERQMRLGGMLANDGKMMFSIYKWYNVDGEDLPSHGMSETNLKETKSRGLWRLGAFHCQKTGGFMCNVPESWQKDFGFPFLSGQSLGQGRASSSEGPAAYGFKLPTKSDKPGKTTALEAKHFLGYDIVHTAEYTVDGKTHKWKGSNNVAGVAFPATKDGRSAVVYFVRVGLHPTDWYGEPSEFPGPGKVCEGGRGFHAPPYKVMAWFYDPKDLLEVGSGKKKSFAVRPYAMKDLSSDCYLSCVSVYAAAYDDANRRLYLIEQYADPKNKFESWPVVHAYSFN